MRDFFSLQVSSNDNVARKLPYEIYSVPVYSSDHLYPQSRSEVLDVVYDESDFQSNTIDYDKSDFLTSNFENETGSEFSKTKDVLNKIKNSLNESNLHLDTLLID